MLYSCKRKVLLKSLKLLRAQHHSMAVDISRSWFRFFAFVFFCCLPLYFQKEVLEKLRFLFGLEIAFEINSFAMFFLEPGLQTAYGCTCTYTFFWWCFFRNYIVSKRSQFVICIGYNGLVFRNRYLTFFGIDTCLPGFLSRRLLCFPRQELSFGFLPSSLLLNVLFFSKRFPVLLSVSGFLKFSKNLSFNSKLGRHLFSASLFISKVIFL